MPQSSPLLTINSTVLWLKVILTVATLGVLYFRYARRAKPADKSKAYPLRTKVMVAFAILFSFAAFHNLGTFRNGTFIHHGEMFHYYLGTKYFSELGYYELYNAVIAADSEQDSSLEGQPFYSDLKTYQNTQRQIALDDIDRVKSLFSRERWSAFKDDVAFFKSSMPRPPGLTFVLMDHGYNGSPVSTFMLGMLANLVPVTRMGLLAALDVLLVAAMIVLVFRTFGLEVGALFSVYFFVNMLNDHDYISGSLLRYDWLFCIVAAVCLLEKGRYASAAFFLTLSAMMRVFPAALFFGVAVTIIQNVKTTRSVDKKYIRFGVAAGVTALVLFLLPAVSLGSVLKPWKDFSAKAELHDSGVYVNHLGLRGIVLFEPSHLSLDSFAKTFSNTYTNDIVRHWQNVKEREFKQRRPVIIGASILVLLCLSAIIWKRKASASESVLWPLLLIYTFSFPSHYYYAFLCLFILLFFRPSESLAPIVLLLVLNVCVLVTDYFGPSPIVFYTLANIYLFICLSAILGFELYANVLRRPIEMVASSPAPQEPRREVWRRPRRTRTRRK